MLDYIVGEIYILEPKYTKIGRKGIDIGNRKVKDKKIAKCVGVYNTFGVFEILKTEYRTLENTYLECFGLVNNDYKIVRKNGN